MGWFRITLLLCLSLKALWIKLNVQVRKKQQGFTFGVVVFFGRGDLFGCLGWLVFWGVFFFYSWNMSCRGALGDLMRVEPVMYYQRNSANLLINVALSALQDGMWKNKAHSEKFGWVLVVMLSKRFAAF